MNTDPKTPSLCRVCNNKGRVGVWWIPTWASLVHGMDWLIAHAYGHLYGCSLNSHHPTCHCVKTQTFKNTNHSRHNICHNFFICSLSYFSYVLLVKYLPSPGSFRLCFVSQVSHSGLSPPCATEETRPKGTWLCEVLHSLYPNTCAILSDLLASLISTSLGLRGIEQLALFYLLQKRCGWRSKNLVWEVAAEGSLVLELRDMV